MRSRLAALPRDPRLIACSAAILWLLHDDHPAQPYGTFRDPGAALMLSLIFGDALAAAVQRQWDRTGKWLFWTVTVFKVLGCQSVFYIQDAGLLDCTFLLVTHFVIGALAFRRSSFELALLRGVMGAAAVFAGLVVFHQLEQAADEHHSIKGLYYTYALMRALIPYLFWTAMLAVARVSKHFREEADLRRRILDGFPEFSGVPETEPADAQVPNENTPLGRIPRRCLVYVYFGSLLAKTLLFLGHDRLAVGAIEFYLEPLVILAGWVSMFTAILLAWQNRNTWPCLVLALIVFIWCAHPEY